MVDTFTTIDTRDFRVGDTVGWATWSGDTTTTITHTEEFRYSRRSADGYTESIDHHWGRHARPTRYTVTR